MRFAPSRTRPAPIPRVRDAPRDRPRARICAELRPALHVQSRSQMSDSRFDLMYTGNQLWSVGEPGRMTFDVARDDYFMANVPGRPDLSNSPYLESPYPVSVTVTGPGSVASSPAGIDCPGSCTGKFLGSVTLAAIPREGATFTGWTGACSGTATCVITREGSAAASFVVNSHERTLTLRGRGQSATGILGGRRRRFRVVPRARPGGGRAPRTSRGWSIVRRARTNGAGGFTVSTPKGRATYRARAPQTTADGERCVKAVSRTMSSSG